MILTGLEIRKRVLEHQIVISPFDDQNITTNTYDLTLGNQFIEYTEPVLDPRKDNKFKTITVENGAEITMSSGDFLLGHSRELVGSDLFVPIIHAKSGIARLGLFVHVTADLIDIGSKGNITFQLFATLPITLTPGIKIAQVSFWQPKGTIELYKGKYQNSVGPRASQSFADLNPTN